MNVYSLLPTESFGSNMYILESNGEYAVIDPSLDFQSAVRKYPELKYGMKYIILTHAHFDHFLEIDSWKRETSAEVLLGSFDAPSLKDPYKNAYRIFFGEEKGYYGEFRTLLHEDVIKLGGEEIRVISTPGHTPGGISLLTGNLIFVGDTVFADGGYGRYDLPGGDLDALIYSIRYLSSLDSGIKVYPGHGRSTTIDEIRKYFDKF